MIQALPDVMLAKLPDSPGCWLWLGGMSGDGYGALSVDGRIRRAHRVQYEASVGPIPAGHSVLHKCDVTLCVRPDHLFTGTPADNAADMVAKGRQARGTTNGLFLNPEARARGLRNGMHTHPERRPRMRGSAHGRSKLVEPQVVDIRHQYDSGQCRNKAELARKFNVSGACIRLILRRKKWSHV